jgi:UDP-glucose 4-epimerase
MSGPGKVLITGGRGFVGVNLVRALGASRDLRVLDNLSRCSPTGWSGTGAEMVECDILDRSRLAVAMDGVSHVVHLAAYGSVIESIGDPDRNFEINARGTLNVLNAAVDSGVKRLVFASTGGALIGDATPPVNEDSVPRPISPYGASKLCGEGYCHAFAKSYELETVCVRFGNVYGPDSAHKKGAVTMFIKALMQDEPIVIFGDGSASRDYIHADDICAGIMAAMDTKLAGPEVFHLASGRETTVLELARLLCDIAGKPDHPIEFRGARRGEVTRNFATYDKASKVLGFQPGRELEEGLAETWEWYQQQGEVALTAELSDS